MPAARSPLPWRHLPRSLDGPGPPRGPAGRQPRWQHRPRGRRLAQRVRSTRSRRQRPCPARASPGPARGRRRPAPAPSPCRERPPRRRSPCPSPAARDRSPCRPPGRCDPACAAAHRGRGSGRVAAPVRQARPGRRRSARSRRPRGRHRRRAGPLAPAGPSRRGQPPGCPPRRATDVGGASRLRSCRSPGSRAPEPFRGLRRENVTTGALLPGQLQPMVFSAGRRRSPAAKRRPGRCHTRRHAPARRDRSRRARAR